MPFPVEVEHPKCPLLLFLCDVVPEPFTDDCCEDCPYPAPAPRCPESRRDEVPHVRLAVVNPIRFYGLPVELFESVGFPEILGLDVPERRSF
jgi:hypothetical protein